MTVQKFSPTDSKITIYAEPANLNYFLTTELTPASEGAVVNKTATVKAHTRRQYVGDKTPVNVSGSERTYMYDPGRKVGNALPGESFILDDGVEKRQMTFSGNVVDLHAFLIGDAKMEFKLYTTGARYVIPKST
jgi:hypothetical protein